MSRVNQLTELLQKEPNDPFLNYALALEYAKLDEKQKAIALIEKIIQSDENYLAAYYQLGQFYEQANDTEKARAAYVKGIEIARKQNNTKTMGELNTALLLLE